MSVRKGEVIYSQGDPADAVFYIQRGKLRASVLSDEGKEAIFASILGADEFFGDKCLVGLTERTWTISAITDAVVVRIEKHAMLRLLEENPTFSHLFMTHILNHTIQVEASLIDRLFNSSERRLARLLLQLAHYGKEGSHPDPIIVKISQEHLAEMIGTTRSRVSFFMNRFRRLGYIHYNGYIHVHKSLTQVLLHEERRIKD